MNVLWYDVIASLPRPAARALPAHPTSTGSSGESGHRLPCMSPARGDTKHLVNAQRIALMKPGAVIINTSRPSVIDEPALIAALRGGPGPGGGPWMSTTTSRRRTPKTIESPLADLAEPVRDAPHPRASHGPGPGGGSPRRRSASWREYKNSGNVLNCVNG